MGKRGPKKGSGGRPAKLTIDDKLLNQVEAMAGLGLTIEQISLILGVSPATTYAYKRNFPKLSRAYQRGRARGAMQVMNNLRTQSNAGGPGAVAAAIFYLKTQCGWSEKTQVEVSGPDKKPVEMVGAFTGLTKEGADDLRKKILGVSEDDD